MKSNIKDLEILGTYFNHTYFVLTSKYKNYIIFNVKTNTKMSIKMPL